MSDISITSNQLDKTDSLFIVFNVWAFILLCRPQDYFSFLAVLRPGLTLGLITLLIYFVKNKYGESIYKNNQFKLFTLMIFVMFVGTPFSYYRSASLNDVFSYASINLMFFYLFYQLVDTLQKLKKILFTICTGIAVYAIYTLKSGTLSDGRLTFGSMFDPNDITYLMITFITFNILFFKSDNKLQKIIAVTNIIISMIVIMKTGSRGGLIALSTVLAYLLFTKTSTVAISFVKKTALTTMVIVSLLYFVDVNSARYKTLLDMKEDYNITDEEGRLAIWKTGMRMILSRPLTGVGMNQFSQGVGRDREERGLPTAKWQAPHNSIVQIGAETGVFGLAIFCLLSFNVFRIMSMIISSSCSEELLNMAEMARVGFLGHFVCAMFISQAYSVYWVFYIILSSVLSKLMQNEISCIENFNKKETT